MLTSVDFSKAKDEGFIRIFDPVDAYASHIQDLIDLEPIKNAGLKILVDSMWGNGAGWFPKFAVWRKNNN